MMFASQHDTTNKAANSRSWYTKQGRYFFLDFHLAGIYSNIHIFQLSLVLKSDVLSIINLPMIDAYTYCANKNTR